MQTPFAKVREALSPTDVPAEVQAGFPTVYVASSHLLSAFSDTGNLLSFLRTLSRSWETFSHF